MSFSKTTTVLALAPVLALFGLVSIRSVGAFLFAPPCTTTIRSYTGLGHQQQQHQRTTRLFSYTNNQQPGIPELENEEALSVLFQRALVLQRSGEIDQALEQYDLFCKAAVQCDVNPSQYAEVHVNMGAIYLRKSDRMLAKYHFDMALHHRPTMGKAHVNLAVLHLQHAQQQREKDKAMECLAAAKEHCQKAIALNDDSASVETATRLMKDVFPPL